MALNIIINDITGHEMVVLSGGKFSKGFQNIICSATD